MADRVIVVGAKRARQRVPASEIKQMIGRAGRKHNGETCRATVVVEEDVVEELQKDMDGGGGLVVNSSLSNESVLAFHMLPEICHGTIERRVDMSTWYSRSFAFAQNKNPDFEKALRLLEESESVVWDGDRVLPTTQGKVSSSLYFHPADVWAWRENFQSVFDLNLENDDTAVSWALGTVPVTTVSGSFGTHWEAVEECRTSIPPGLLILIKGTLVTVTLWRYLLGGPTIGPMRNPAIQLQDDIGRICRAMRRIDNSITKWGREEFFDELEYRIRRRIPNHLVQLCKLEGITKGRAAYLYESGFRGIEDIPDAISALEGDVDDKFMDALRGNLNVV